jgi:hypothetical protein
MLQSLLVKVIYMDDFTTVRVWDILSLSFIASHFSITICHHISLCSHSGFEWCCNKMVSKRLAKEVLTNAHLS